MPKQNPKDKELIQDLQPVVNPEVNEEDNKGPTIVMTGVSGKKITADVKVVKVKKKSKKMDEAEMEVLPTKKEEASTSKPTQVPEQQQVQEKPQAEVQTQDQKQEKPQIEEAVREGKIGKVEKNEISVQNVSTEGTTGLHASTQVEPKKGKETEKTASHPKEKRREKTPNLQKESGAEVQPESKKDRHVETVAKTETTGTSTAASKPENKNKKESGSKVDPAKSSLAATAAYFAARAAARKKEAEERTQKGGSGRNNRGPSSGNRSQGPHGSGRGNGASSGAAGGRRDNRGGSSYGGKSFGAGSFGNKDKDEEPKLQSHSRTPARKPNPLDLEILENSKESNRSAFASRDGGRRNNDRRNNERKEQEGRTRNPSRNRSFDYGDDEFQRGRKKGGKKREKTAPVVHAVLTNISLPEIITVKEFAEAIKKTSGEVIKELMKLGVMATLNQEIDYDTASLISNEFGITTEKLVEVTEEDILFDDSEDAEEDLQTRPPVVCVMGHVDHGKTSLLDYIRSAEVAQGEAGGITQHIGAYMVDLNGRKITFLDTPGHEAFTTMRARGAQATDIAILVVAADDGVMPQTVEAINHAKAAGTQLIVAINKMDRPGANPDRVKEELSKYEVIPEEWGGSTIMVPVSAKTGQGIEELLEMVLLTADVLDLKANPNRQAKGIVIEAKLDKQRGPVATLLVNRGTLHVGDTVVMGEIVGRVRAMTDAKGKQRKEAGPSVPVEIIGIPDVPSAGDTFYQVENEKIARQLAEKRRVQNREKNISGSSRMSLDNLFSQMASGEVKDLNLIVKADVQGSVEAVNQAMLKLSNDEVKIKIVHSAVGAITESDLNLAEVANAIVIGFNVRPAANVADKAKENGIDLRLYRVIYHAIEEIEAAMKGLLAPKLQEVDLGRVEIRQVFKASNIGTIGGGYVLQGKITRGCQIRLVRDGVIIWDGKLANLKRFKDDVREVAQGYECGISLENFNDIKEGDVVEAYEIQEVERT